MIPSATTVWTMPLTSAFPSLALELRIGQLHADHRRQALTHVLAGEVGVLLGENRRLARPVVQGAGQRGTEPGDVGAAVHGVDVVGERQHVLGEAVVVLQRDLDAGRVDHPLHMDRLRVKHGSPPVQVANEAGDTALEVEDLLAVGALVDEPDPEPLVQVGRLPEAGGDRLPAEVERLEHGRVGREEAARAVLAVPGRVQPAIGLRCPAGLLHRTLRLPAVRVLLHPALAVAQHLDPHLGRQGVDHRHADAMQAAGHLVPAAAELAAGVEDGVHDLESILAARVAPDRDAAAVIHHLDRCVGVDGDVHAGGDVGHRLVDAVVHQLPDELVQAPRIGRADVHARPLADGLQALQDLDVGGRVAVAALSSCPARRLHGHARVSCCVVGVSVPAASTGMGEVSAGPPAPRVMMA
jgi:hypothetical protein